jgi:hypothetical protein
MGRVLRVIALVFLLGQVIGAWSSVAADDCAPGCDDDATGKDCPPACPTCSCTVRSASAATTAFVVPHRIPAVRVIALAPCDGAPPSPDPREILHVPKLLAA